MRGAPLFLIPLLVACSPAPASPTVAAKAPGRYVETIKVGQLDRRFVLRVPKGYDGSHSIPLVMVLHGWTSSADQAEQYTRMADKADREGFAAVFPDGLGNPGYQGWNAEFIDLTGKNRPDDVGFLTAVLDQTEREINVDRKREYVVGHSNGAFMANALGAHLAGRLAAIASVAGSVGLSSEQTIAKPAAPLNVLLLHGTADRMVAYGPSDSALFKGVGARASAEWWAKADGCDVKPETAKTGGVTVDRYLHGKDGTEVELVTVEGAPHDWWGGLRRSGERIVDVPTYGAPVADLVWEFFKSHPKR